MEPQNWWLCLIVLFLANFRLSILVSDDTCPFGICEKLRNFFKRKAKTDPLVRKSKQAEGIQCKRCTSVQLAIPMVAWVFLHSSLPVWLMMVGDGFLLAMALSGASIILLRAFPQR